MMEKISWTNRVINEKVFCRVIEERNLLRTTKRRKANWIGHILSRNWLLKYLIKGKVEGTGTLGRRRKQVLDHLKGKRRY
jgi:hypothetical protein